MLRIDKIGFGDKVLWQEDKWFCYGVDAVILAHFARLGYLYGSSNIGKALQKSLSLQEDGKSKSICDLGSGNGIIPVILSETTKSPCICGLEVQEGPWELFSRNIEANNLGNRVFAMKGNVNELTSIESLLEKNELTTGKRHFDIVTCNPPYTESKKGVRGELSPKVIARHEIEGTLWDFVEGASKLLSDKGLFVMVHRPFRLDDILISLNHNRIRPKGLQLISGRADEPPNLMIIWGVKGGGQEMSILPQRYVREADEYSAFIKRAYLSS